MGEQSLVYFCTLQSCKSNYRNDLCSKTKWPLEPAACFCSVTFCLWITTDLVMCIYNESIYSILNLKDVDSTLIKPMWFCVVYLNRL